MILSEVFHVKQINSRYKIKNCLIIREQPDNVVETF